MAEALALADRLGIDPAKLEEAIAGGPLDAPIADAKLHKMERGDYAPEFPLQWALKDVDLAMQAAGDDEPAAAGRAVAAVACRRRRRSRPRGRQRGPAGARRLLIAAAAMIIHFICRGNAFGASLPKPTSTHSASRT